MTRTSNKGYSKTSANYAKTQRLILGRLALTFFLAAVSWLWIIKFGTAPSAQMPETLVWLVLAAIGLTALYFLILRSNRNYLLQARLQFLVDIVLITVLCVETATLDSPFVTLYIVLVSVSGVFLGKRDTLIFSIICAVSFSMLSLFSSESVFQIAADGGVPRTLQILAFNSVSILIVGLLAANLAERRKIKRKLKATEESFEDLNVLHEVIIQSMRSGLITTDLAGRMRSFNRAAEDITGIRAVEVIGDSVYTLFGEDIRPSVDISLRRAAENDEFPTEHFEAVISSRFAKSGTTRKATVACSVVPLIGKSGMVNGLIIVFQDISDIRSMELSLRRADRLAVVGRMAAGLAHEIRNPLGSISSALQFLEENIKASAPESELLSVVQSEADRLNNIITNFLSYSRRSAGRVEKEQFQSMDIRAAIEDCMVLFRHSVEVEPDHIFNSDLPKTPVFINANETRIKQVLWNLVQNSIQAMPGGGKLDLKLSDIPGNRVKIILEDTGCGIKTRDMEHLFEPFSSGARGAGLGLSIVHSIVEDHGGKLDISSKVGEGTRVTVELPHRELEQV
ncbi:MAG: PAS domain S-box protein [Pyrinomonadaceae bacterium]|nr:PAS domain S-box protein [Pyrinomonadaceae bacterium]